MSVTLTNPIRQIPGHYQVVAPSRFGIFEPSKVCDIEDLVGILLEHDIKPFSMNGFLIVTADVEEDEDSFDGSFEYEEINTSWGTVEFSKQPHLFPTSVDSRWGAIVNHMGKEYYISFDEDDCLAIGYGDKLYRFDNATISEDCLEIYAMVFEGIIPNEPVSV